jgi:hypothetical protein
VGGSRLRRLSLRLLVFFGAGGAVWGVVLNGGDVRCATARDSAVVALLGGQQLSLETNIVVLTREVR